MTIIIKLLVYAVVFSLLYALITILPIPARLAWLRTVLIIVLILVAILVLLGLAGIPI
jgi:hypothetical protein